jgi:hypothetical protein
LVFPNSFHLGMMEATVFLGTFNAAEMSLYPCADLCLYTIMSQSSMDNSFDLVAWFLLWHALSTVGVTTPAVVGSPDCSGGARRSSSPITFSFFCLFCLISCTCV